MTSTCPGTTTRSDRGASRSSASRTAPPRRCEPVRSSRPRTRHASPARTNPFFAFVVVAVKNRTPTHPSSSNQQDAIKEFDQKELNGRPIACRFAEKPRPDNPREAHLGGGRGGRGGRGGDYYRGGGGSYGGSYSSRRPYGGGDDYGPSRGAYREVYDRRGPYDRRDSDYNRGRDDYYYDRDRGYSDRGGYEGQVEGIRSQGRLLPQRQRLRQGPLRRQVEGIRSQGRAPEEQMRPQ